jgi:hypothetical protein
MIIEPTQTKFETQVDNWFESSQFKQVPYGFSLPITTCMRIHLTSFTYSNDWKWVT